jgi:hypothetical protein
MDKTPGQVAYEASGLYLASKYLEDQDPWDCQLPGTKGHWEAAACAIIEMCASALEVSAPDNNLDLASYVYESARKIHWKEAAASIRSLAEEESE